MKFLLVVMLALVLGALAYVRLAPYDAARWHVAPDPMQPGDTESAARFIAAREMTAAQQDVLRALDRVIMATARTKRLSGSVAQDMITYQTRSRLFGFPDYTTVTIQAAQDTTNLLLVIHGRLRFGGSDMGVNRTRIIGWLTALGPLTVAP
jgi:uncharacterized protein (DUF1499 family)